MRLIILLVGLSVGVAYAQTPSALFNLHDEIIMTGAVCYSEKAATSIAVAYVERGADAADELYKGYHADAACTWGKDIHVVFTKRLQVVTGRNGAVNVYRGTYGKLTVYIPSRDTAADDLPTYGCVPSTLTGVCS